MVEGGHRLGGTIEPAGNKNAALPIIAASLLTERPVPLENVPRIRDTETLVELIRSVGASAEWRQRNTLDIHAKSIRSTDLDPVLCARIRASILLAGPLLARCREVMPPPPGGDVSTPTFWLSSSSARPWSQPTGWSSGRRASGAPTSSSTSQA